MTTLWLNRMCDYKYSKQGLISARNCIIHKINHQYLLVKSNPPLLKSKDMGTSQSLLLYEARAAKVYWKLYKKELPVWVAFLGRNPRATDITNKLLDIGYHVLAQKVLTLLLRHSVSPVLAILHKAHSEKSNPLVYDLMELFRADIVDKEVLHYLNQKKKPVETLSSYEIRKFVTRINTHLKKKVYLRDFKQCHTYEYYMELQILTYIKAVNHHAIFIPRKIPSRHENRCS